MAKKTDTRNVGQKLKFYLLAHVDAFKTSFHNLSIKPFSSLMTSLAIGLCLALPLAFYLFIINFQQISQHWNHSTTLSIYIAPNSSTAEIDVIKNKIQSYPFVEKVNYTSASDALKEFKAVSNLDDVLELLPENPLPAVLHVQIDSKGATKQRLDELKTTLNKQPQVVKAAFDFEWIEKINAIMYLAKTIANILFLMIGFGVILMVSNTIRLSLERHRDEIEVMVHIGATNAFIQRPYLYRGLMYALIGGIIALALVSIMQFILKTPIQQVNSLYFGVFHLENLTFYDTLLLLSGCGLLGWLGASVAFVQQHSDFCHN